MLNKSLLALACGDSYGSYFERVGLIGTTFDMKLLPEVPVETKITDDTKMANILLKHYLEHKTIKQTMLLNSYKKWASEEGQKDGIGIHTYQVLLKNKLNKNSEGNGALMRIIPFGVELINDGYSFEEAVSIMNKESSITHKNETIFMANRLSLDIAINGIEVIEKPIYENILSQLHSGYTAWVLHSLYIVIEALKMDLSFIDGFKYIVSNGGDTDTNCAIYGAIRGYREDVSDSIKISDFLTTNIVEKLTKKGI